MGCRHPERIQRKVTKLGLVPHVLAFAGCAGPVEIVAHRGASHDAPENTLVAVELAWDQGADAVEVDVRLTRDGRLVVIHDDTTARTTGVDGKVEDRTLDELRALDAGSWKGPSWKGTRIPTIEEVLAAVPPRKQLLIELKCGPQGAAPLARALRGSRLLPGRVRAISFQAEALEALRKEVPGIRSVLLAGWGRDETTGRWVPSVDDLVAKASSSGFQGLGLAAMASEEEAGPLDEAAASAIRAAGLELHVWTVNDPDLARRMAALGARSITTDRPGWLRAQLR